MPHANSDWKVGLDHAVLARGWTEDLEGVGRLVAGGDRGRLTFRPPTLRKPQCSVRGELIAGKRV